MSRRHAWLAALPLAALLLAGCQPPAETSPTGGPMTESTRPPLRTTTPGPVAPSGTPAAVPAARWEAIEADLAARGVTAGPELVSAEAVTFTDGALGCPEPGLSYTQALVDGMRVVVTAGGTTYDYRFGGDAASPKLCER